VEPRLDLNLIPSQRLSLFLLLLHLSAFLALLLVVDLFWLWPLTLIIIMSWVFYGRKLACYRDLSCLYEEQWSLTDRKGQRRLVRLTGGVVVGEQLLLLSFAANDGKTCSLFLAADSMEKQSFRRLRARLTLLRTLL